jgi:hypothetical protein
VPFIECHIKTGLTPERREELIRDIIQVTHDSIGSDPKIINARQPVRQASSLADRFKSAIH